MSGITFNPYITTNAAGSFNIDTTGFVQGTLLDNPVFNMLVAGGVVSQSATAPMYGGCGISEQIPYPGGVTTPNGYGASTDTTNALGGNLLLAQSIANTLPLTGFTVFNASQALLNWPQSPVPSTSAGGSINFVRVGSGVHLALACDPILVSLENSNINQQVSWDFDLQQLIPYVAYYAEIAISVMAWANTAGGTVTITAASSPGLVAGDVFQVVGAVPTAYNGSWVASAGTSGTTVKFLLPAATTPGTVTTLGDIQTGGGAAPVKVLNVYPGNSMVVVPTTNGFTWNRSGCTAVVQI